MSADPVQTLQQWAQAKQLEQATLSADGTSLSLDGTVLPTDKVTVSHEGKECVYTLGSIFLQILKPDQSLVQYRSTCKKHAVKDPIKALDKPTILGFFLGGDEGSAIEKPEAAPAAVTVAAAAAPPKKDDAPAPKTDEQMKAKEKRREEKRREEKRRKERKLKHRTSSSTSREEKERAKRLKPKPKEIDPAKLFSNLVHVVGKRQASTRKQQEEQEQLLKALSPEGFDVTPALLDEYKEVTQNLTQNEIPVGNSASILQAAAGKDLSRVLKLYLEEVNGAIPTTTIKSSSKSSSGRKASSSSGGLTPPPKKVWRDYLVGKKPIIVLPKGMTAPLTMLNAHEFFAHSKFVPRDIMMKQKREGKTSPTTFSRRVGSRLGGGLVEYELMDNPKSKLLSSKEWERVVAVVALGHAWQFKDWPSFYSNPVQLFGETFGFFVGLEGDKLPGDLQGWSVVQTRLSRDKRGLDSVSCASFWNGLDEFMAIRKPELLPQSEHN